MPRISFFKSREHAIQVEYFNLLSRVNHPAVRLTVAIPNQALALLTKVIRIWFKAEGVKAGFPDTVSFYPSPHRSGLLVIEFKKPGDDPRENQVNYLQWLADAGHHCYVVDNARTAFNLWLDHHGISVTF